VQSAFGIMASDVVHSFSISDPMEVDDLSGLNRRYAQLEEQGLELLRREGFSQDGIEIHRQAEMRYHGQVHEVTVPVASGHLGATEMAELIAGFEQRYQSLYGRGTAFSEAGYEIVTLRVDAIGRTRKPVLPRVEPEEVSAVQPLSVAMTQTAVAAEPLQASAEASTPSFAMQAAPAQRAPEVGSVPTANEPLLLAQQSSAAASAMAAASPQQMSQPCMTGAYTGEPISLNLKDVDLKDFFRLMHEVSGLNVVLDPNVSGVVTIVLDEVPWDQAMDIVDRNNGLDCTRTGNVVRIARVSTLEAEAKALLAKAQAEEQREKQGMPLATITRTLSYAKATELVTPLKPFLSPRGNMVPDLRTNTTPNFAPTSRARGNSSCTRAGWASVATS